MFVDSTVKVPARSQGPVGAEHSTIVSGHAGKCSVEPFLDVGVTVAIGIHAVVVWVGGIQFVFPFPLVRHTVAVAIRRCRGGFQLGPPAHLLRVVYDGALTFQELLQEALVDRVAFGKRCACVLKNQLAGFLVGLVRYLGRCIEAFFGPLVHRVCVAPATGCRHTRPCPAPCGAVRCFLLRRRVYRPHVSGSGLSCCSVP